MSTDNRYVPESMEYIEDALSAAKKQAALTDKPVKMEFNEISFEITRDSDPEALASSYWERRKAKDAETKNARQANVEQTIGELDGAIEGGLKTLVSWIRKYACDAAGVNPRSDLVLPKLSAAGYTAGGFMREDYEGKNKDFVGRSIVGRLMYALENREAPIALVDEAYCDVYLNMPDQVTSKAGTKPKQRR